MPGIESLSSLEEETMKYEDKRRVYKFSSRISLYLTLLGYSASMSDIWRFPYLVFRNGGGAFLIPFVIMIFLCGMPMYFLEFSIGKFSGRGPYKVWDISPLFRGIGVTISLAYTVYMIGTTIFRCWILEFVIYAFRDPIPWSHCNNKWNTPFCKDTETFLRSADLTTVAWSNVSRYENSPTAYNVTETFKTSTLTTSISLNVSGTPMTSVEEFWQYQVLQLSSGVTDLSPVIWRYFLYMFLFRLTVFLCSIKGIKSIEKVFLVTSLAPILLLVAIFIRSLMLPGSEDGIVYFFYPDFRKMLQAKVWIEATLMAFYTLAFGWGSNILLGSHADFKNNCIRTCIVLPIMDMLVAIFSGVVCFSVLGNMAHSYSINVTEVITAGMATGMVSYITALMSLPVPQVWTGLFLLSVLITSIDSQLVPLDLVMQLIGDIFPRAKKGFRIPALLVVSLVIFFLSLVFCTGAGAFMFLWVDWYGGAWIGPIVAFVEVVVVAWIYGMDRFNEDIYMMTGRQIPALLRLGVAFVAPLTVAVVFFTSVIEYLPPKYGAYTYRTLARALGWILVAVIILPMFIHAFRMLRKSAGSSLKNIKQYVKPLDSWGPCDADSEEEEEFHQKKSKYHNRRYRDLLYYNVFGKYPSSSEMTTILRQELDMLNKSVKNMKA